MKKPNITEYDWRVFNSTDIFTNKGDGDEHLIADCFMDDNWSDNPISIEQQYANAKAISAVPEMIDALIHSHGQICIALTHDETIPIEVLVEWATKIETVLKKAGAKL